MAGARLCATILPAAAPPKIPISSSSVSLPSKLTRRKNHLRPKILKTLNPKPDPQPLTQPISPVVSPPQHNHELDYTSDQSGVVSAETAEVEEVTASETGAELSGINGKFTARDVLKYGGYFVGLFLLQTVISVMFSSDSDTDENRKFKSLGTGESDLKSSRLSWGNVVRFDESEAVEKIEEIRAMARRARQIEKNEVKGDGGVLKSESKVGIEKEVGNRLVGLQKRLGKKRGKEMSEFVTFMEMVGRVEDEVRKSGENVKEENGELMFKKKLKFKTPTAEVGRNPKGFGGEKVDGGEGEDRRGSSGGDGIASVGTDGMELLEADGKGKESGRLEEGQDREDGTTEPQNGTVRRSIQGGSSSEGVMSNKPRGFGNKSRASLKKEIQGTKVKSDGPAVLSVSSVSKQKGAGKQALVNKVRGKQAENETDPWWLHLPYVLVIFMRRGSDGQGGLFSIELNSESQNESDDSYTVAFQDRGDANNFCFLLESCFENEDNFTANAAPLPNKELHKAIKSDGMKVIVVKKGQLKLYAGQPFAEVEMALRSLVVES